MEYRIQPGDTISGVTRRLGMDWDSFKQTNPHAVGRSAKSGEWIIKAGKTVHSSSSFHEVLAKESSRPASAGQASMKANAHLAVESKEKIHTLKKGETIWELGNFRYRVDPAEIMAFNNITEPGKLRVGQQIRIPAPDRAPAEVSGEEVTAGWYGAYHQGRLMANGQPFDMNQATIAHPSMPIGTKVELENPKTGEKATAEVTDRGPYHRGRDVDLSYELAKRLSITKQGVGNLKMRVL